MTSKKLSIVFAAVLVTALGAIVAYGIGTTSPKPVIEHFDGEMLLPSGPPAPNPGDTLKYDDGAGAWFVSYGAGNDLYWASMFTPAQNCTLKEVHCAIYVKHGTPPVCTLHVWDDNAGNPGTPIYTATFNPVAMTPWWNYIDITTTITFPASTNFWVGYFIKAPAGADTSAALEDAALQNGGLEYVNVGGTWYSLNSEGHPGDILLRAYVEYFGAAATHDVAPDSITVPPDTVVPGSNYIPTAWVHNYGDTSEIFGVECLINPGAYGDTFVVMSLAPGANVQCFFDQWDVPATDSVNYTMCVRTLLSKDMDKSNDTLCKNIYAISPAIHDCGVDWIVDPPDTISVGVSYDPTCHVANFGSFTETFAVICRIDSSGNGIYGDTSAVVNLGPASGQQVGFNSWVPSGPGVTYDICFWTVLAGDAVPSNDTLCKSSYSVTAVAERFDARRSGVLALNRATPNPFSVTTSISYVLPVSGKVNLSIYGIGGSLVRTLVDGEAAGGSYTTTWNGTSDAGSLVPGGVYFCKLSVGTFESTSKMVFVR